MSTLTRRGFLAGTGGVIAACGSSTPAVRANPDTATGATQDWVLDVQWLHTELDGVPVKLRTYGLANQHPSIPGPTLKTYPGQTLSITVRNHLTPYDSSDWGGDHNVPHMLNTTNLHLHGLEIVPHLFEPVGTSDPHARMIAISPGHQYHYAIKVPDDQPPGLFWYHPHHHGSTAVQAVTGMAGPLIVHGAIDEVPGIKAARDIVLTINDIGLFPSDKPNEKGLWTYEPQQNAIWDTFTGKVRLGAAKNPPVWSDLQGGFTTGDYALRYYAVNGQPFFKEVHNTAQPTEPTGAQLSPPRFTMAQGEVIRFRILNACSDNLMPIVVEGHEMHLIALDGVNFPAPRTIPVKNVLGCDHDRQILLAPANRAEFLIKGIATPGVYRIQQLQQSQQFLFSAAKTIAEIEITDQNRNMTLPAKLPLPTRHYPLIKPAETDRKKKVVEFSATFPGVKNTIVGMDLMINGALYSEEAVETYWDTEVGAVEEWTLKVPDDKHGGNEGHPFHIHVNSFEVISIGGVLQLPGTIQDTIWVHKDSDVVIRMRFREWSGKSVFHCHILPHEDTGMMKNFLIKKKED